MLELTVLAGEVATGIDLADCQSYSLGFSRGEVLGGKFRSLTDGSQEAALIGNGGTCYVKCGPVIDGSAHDGEAYGYVHA
jgi:hypothetical protein